MLLVVGVRRVATAAPVGEGGQGLRRGSSRAVVCKVSLHGRVHLRSGGGTPFASLGRNPEGRVTDFVVRVMQATAWPFAFPWGFKSRRMVKGAFGVGHWSGKKLLPIRRIVIGTENVLSGVVMVPIVISGLGRAESGCPV